MSLLSNTFALFLASSLLVYYICPRKFQWIVLLLASCTFYAYSGIANFAFILFSSFITFFCAAIISNLNDTLKTKKETLTKDDFKTEKKKTLTKKRLVLMSMIVLNVGILFYLKYWRVLIGSRTFLLPLGISYYTLSTIGYFMDIYNGV